MDEPGGKIPAPEQGPAPSPESDLLAAQPTGQAEDALAGEDRMQGLLRASRAVVADLSLESVLRNVVEAGCALVDAPFGALGVIAPDGNGLERFIHVGIDEATSARLGSLPEGKGLLGALIEDPRPIRLTDLRDDLRSVGFPAGHPPMRGFLGVPIRVRDEIYGNLYLASLDEGSFSDQDEELVGVLAATAGVAIANARMYEESKHRQEWLAAANEVTRRVLEAPDDQALHLVGERVAELAEADAAAVVLPEDGARLRVRVAVGPDAADFLDHTYDLAGTLSEVVMRTGKPRMITDASREGSGVAMARVIPLGPVMVLPLTGSRGTRGALVVGRRPGRREFTAADLDMASAFARYASVSLELADGRAETQRMAMLEDRARIARDLHDHVIQQLFAAGMKVQGVLARGPGDDATRSLLGGVVDDIDDAIHQIRTSIFQLRPDSMGGGGLRARVLAVASEVTPALGWNPQLRFEGPVDAATDADLVADVAAVVRETLSNTARHARASRAQVEVRIRGNSLEVCVEDDGVGLGASERRSGLDNLISRAEARGGQMGVTTGRLGGLLVRWRVPLWEGT